MKRIFFLVTLVFCINCSLVFATEPQLDNNQQISNEIKQSILYRAMNNSLYSKWGWNQIDVVTQHLANNNGFKKELGVQDVASAATIENIQYGNIIGVCEIDFKKLDKYIEQNILEENIDDVIKIVDEYYIELKCNDITLSYMNINEDERISHFIEPGMLKSEYIKDILPQEMYINPVVYLIEDNKYIKGIYVKTPSASNIITYQDFNSTDNTQFSVSNTIDVLKEADEDYLIDNPRVDYELLEQQKLEQIQQLIEEGKQRDIVLYSITGVLAIALIVVIVICIKIMKKM